MHIDALREAVRRHPFIPFTLRMNDGREFHVPHPEYLAISRRWVVVVDPATDATTFLEPVLIASMEPRDGTPPQAQPEATGGGNP